MTDSSIKKTVPLGPSSSRLSRRRLDPREREQIKGASKDVDAGAFGGASTQSSRVIEEKPVSTEITPEHSDAQNSPNETLVLPWEDKNFVGNDHRGMTIKRGFSPKISAETAEMLRWLREDRFAVKSQIDFIQTVVEKAIREKVAEQLKKEGLNTHEAKKKAGMTYVNK